MHRVQLGLDLTCEAQRLRLYDPLSGEPLLRPEEAIHKAAAEQMRAEVERQRAEAEAQARTQAEVRASAAQERADAETRAQAEAELTRLRAELEMLRRNAGN